MRIQIKQILDLGWHGNFSADEIVYDEVWADSRKIKPGSIFFAFDGLKVAGSSFVGEALEKKAAAIFVDKKYEKEINEISKNSNIPVFYSGNFSEMAGRTISCLYNYPTSNMACIGITGTNGKTTIAWVIYSALKALKKKSAYVGTIGIELPENKISASHTTPPVDEVHRLAYHAREQGGEYFVMETSSHGLAQGRLAGVDWTIAMFTNLTEDHRDYHATMEEYFLSKKILFKQWLDCYKKSGNARFAAIINSDDAYGVRLLEWLKSQDENLPLISVGKNGSLKISAIRTSWEGYEADLEFKGAKYTLKSKCIGNYNIYNLAMSFACLAQLGFNPPDFLAQLELFQGAPGRMQRFQKTNGSVIFVDYAHTPDALEKSIKTLRELNPGKVLVVFGCGGDRDQAKRSQMGKIADDLADHTIVTNDNPRSEDPEKIVAQITSTMRKNRCQVIYDRREAIFQAVKTLNAGEVLLVAGKGHEDYQILSSGKINFSDAETVEEAIRSIG